MPPPVCQGRDKEKRREQHGEPRQSCREHDVGNADQLHAGVDQKDSGVGQRGDADRRTRRRPDLAVAAMSLPVSKRAGAVLRPRDKCTVFTPQRLLDLLPVFSFLEVARVA